MPEIFTDPESAIGNAGLRDGMRISFHHHLRLGDRIVSRLLPVIAETGVRNLTLCASSLMGDACRAVLDAGGVGAVRDLETTGMKEPLAGAVLRNEWDGDVVFRSHGGRAGAIARGRTPVDVAFIAASAADRSGNLNGTEGPARFGSLGYGMVDARYASHVVAVTDNLVEGRLEHIAIPGEQVDSILLLESIGDRNAISGGSLRRSNRPVDKLIAGRVVEVLSAAGIIRNGMSFQAGSGAISLLVSSQLVACMEERDIRGSFASGGITAPLVDALGRGIFSKLHDVQSFDPEAVQSLAGNPDHLEMDASKYASPFRDDRVSSQLDAMILSGTEIDTAFNLNSLTGTNGRILGALGGAPDTAEDAALTIVAMPSMRGRIPTINDRVRTVCTPGESVDVLVTERGICVNPRRGDLLSALAEQAIPSVAIDDFKERIYGITGRPQQMKRKESVAVIEDRRGGRLDEVFSTG